jgi:IclR family acetate operon transcriptional repressor
MSVAEPPEEPRTHAVQAVQRTLRLLTNLGEAGAVGAPLSALARVAGLSEPTALRYLRTLVDGEFVEHDQATGRYRLGLGVLVLGERALGDVDPRPLVLPYMEQLRDAFGHTVNLAAFRNGRIVLIEVLEGSRSIKKGARVGEEDQLHSTALGKALLASLPRTRALELLADHGMPSITAHTIVTQEAMEAELDRVAARGYATDEEEGEEGLRCVGVAIRDRRATPSYGLSVSAPVQALDRDDSEQIGAALVDAARELSRRLGHRAETAAPVA